MHFAATTLCSAATKKESSFAATEYVIAAANVHFAAESFSSEATKKKKKNGYSFVATKSDTPLQ